MYRFGFFVLRIAAKLRLRKTLASPVTAGQKMPALEPGMIGILVAAAIRGRGGILYRSEKPPESEAIWGAVAVALVRLGVSKDAVATELAATSALHNQALAAAESLDGGRLDAGALASHAAQIVGWK